ncbi:unnamed protein product [Allacma fusca]|uniref:Diacylglycerol O-acyltransferase n=1 Tax=Allacma fusca TaxID=39272 RepID=A0A8J2PVA7_9HEXA|nr:unnamed protein product [Allacma fusca]
MLRRQILQALVALPLFFIVIPVVVLVAISTLPFKGLVIILAKIFRPDLDDIVTGLSGVFTSYPNLNIVYYWYFDEHLSPEPDWFVRALNDEGRRRYRRLLQYWTTFCGYKFWKEDLNFDSKNHYREYDYTGDLELRQEFTEEDTHRIMGKLITAPWKVGQSPWEAFPIPLPGPSSKTLLIFRHHHALMDGFSTMNYTSEVLRTKIEFKPARKESKTGNSFLYSLLRLPYDLAGYEMDKRMYQPDWQFPPVGGTRDLQSTCLKSITVDKVKLAKNKLDTSYPIVLLSVLAGGLQRMFEEAHLPVPEFLPAVIPLPMPNHPGGTVNHVIIARFRWPIKADSVPERFKRVQEKIQQLSSPALLRIIGMLADLYGSVPAYLSKAVANASASGCSVVTSIFPVVDVTSEMQIRNMVCALGTSGNDIGTTFLSSGLNGDQRIVLIMDKRICPEDKIFYNYEKFVEAELDELLMYAETTGKHSEVCAV